MRLLNTDDIGCERNDVRLQEQTTSVLASETDSLAFITLTPIAVAQSRLAEPHQTGIGHRGYGIGPADVTT